MTSPDETVFRLPDLGEGLTEAEILVWHVAAGDHVVADQPLVSVETDKAVVDVPAPWSGRIAELHGGVGERLAVGDALVTYAAAADSAPGQEAGALVGELQSAATGQTPAPSSAGSVLVSPKARRRARELGVDLTTLAGSGPDGSIQLADVEAAATATVGTALRGVRRAMAQRMADAHARVARATVTGEVEIGAWASDEALLARLVRAVGAACGVQPLLNARFDDRTLTLTTQDRVDLGIAMETEQGLFVPVLRNVTSLDAAAVVAELDRLEAAVRTRRIGLDELRGPTITLSNFGAVAGLHAEMIVVPPQVAIVGAGRVFDRPTVGSPVTRVLPLSLSFDHRAVTGVEACEFLQALAADLELAS